MECTCPGLQYPSGSHHRQSGGHHHRCPPRHGPYSAAATLSCVFVSKSPASWRSCNWLEGSPCTRLTMRPRRAAGRAMDQVGPTLDVLVVLHGQELGRAVLPALHQAAIPRPDRHIRDRVGRHPRCTDVRQAADPARRVAASPPSRTGRSRIRSSSAHRRRSGRSPPPRYGALPICQNSQDRHSARCAGSVGRNAPNFSARYIRIAPDSNTRIGFGPLRSSSAGILEFGLTRHEAAAELVALADPDQPCIVFRARCGRAREAPPA